MHLLIDSHLSREESLHNTTAPPEICAAQALLDIEHWGFDCALHRGQIVVHRELETCVRAIFAQLHDARYAIEKLLPVVHYHWSDDASMAGNNSSGFNYRPIVGGQTPSWHAFGRAIDLNPRFNAYRKGALILPPNAIFDLSHPATIQENSVVVQAFEAHGWSWGGRWTHLHDPQHFQIVW